MPSPRALTTIRVDPGLLQLARIAAAVRGVSVNRWINDAVQAVILCEASRQPGGPLAAALERTAPSPPR